MSVLLSIVVPTLNRRTLLEQTLDSLWNEIRGLDKVELLVVNNASEDDTALFLEQWQRLGRGRVLNFSERANIDGSFQRGVEAAQGQYINIFGDDDFPISGFIRRVLRLLEQYPDIGLFYFNRLISDETLMNMGEVAHPDLGIHDRRIAASAFVRQFTHWPSFISSLVFKRSCWDKGASFSRDEFLGFKFLARLYAGSSGGDIVYSGIPGLIQRRGKQSWKKEWPRYWLLNMPRILIALEESGVTKDALHNWRDTEIGLKRVLVDCIVAKAYGYSWKDPFWVEAPRYQKSATALLIRVLRWSLPITLARSIYFRNGKYQST